MTELTNEREHCACGTHTKAACDLAGACGQAAHRAILSTEGASLPPLPEPSGMGWHFGRGKAVYGYTAEQVEQIRREAVEADREQQKARIQHLTHERDRARLDSQTWHRLVMALGSVFGFDTSGSAAEIGDAASAARANFAAIAGQLARQSQGEIVAWEATTLFYTKYITDSRYQKLRPSFQKWYRPICQKCAAPPLSSEPQAKKGSGE